MMTRFARNRDTFIGGRPIDVDNRLGPALFSVDAGSGSSRVFPLPPSTPFPSGDEHMGPFHRSSTLKSANDPKRSSSSPHDPTGLPGLLTDTSGLAWTADRGEPRYRVFLPLHYTASYHYPVLVWFHEDGHNERQIDRVMPHVSLRNFIGIGIRGNRSSDASGRTFEWSDSPAGIGGSHDAVCDAVERTAAEYSVHTDRIVLAGYRGGGEMAMRLVLRDPQRFAGAVGIGSRFPARSMANLTEIRRRPIPMLWQWASDNPLYCRDHLMPDCRLAMSAGLRVDIRQYPGSDELCTQVFADLNRWIMETVVASHRESSTQWATTERSLSSN